MSDQPDTAPSIRVMMMPRDANPQGTIFGGIILSYIDQAGGIEARKNTPQKFVTVAMNAVEFKQPVFMGDVLSFHTSLVRVGRTSITVHVDVHAERFENPREIVPVTEATLTFVAVDDQRRPTPINLKQPGD
jgi:acyl-CoA thioesterase YciA